MELDPRNLERMIAEGEAQLHALRSGLDDRPDPTIIARLDALDERIEEQHQVLRHMLIMLIEWIEGQGED